MTLQKNIRLTLFGLLLSAASSALHAQSATVGSEAEKSRQVIQDERQMSQTQKEALESDTGVQQVVERKKSKFGGFVGASFSYFYRDNALSVNEPIGDIISSDVITLSGYGAFSYGPFKFMNGIITPYAGFAQTAFRHQEDEVDFADYDNQRVYLLGEWKNRNGWKILPKFDYNRNISEEDDSEEYKAFAPSIEVEKSFPIDNQSKFMASLKTAYNYTEIDDFGVTGRTDDQLDNWSNSVSVNYYRQMLDVFVLNGYGLLIHKNYDKGQNSSREDFLKIIGGSVSYSYNIFRASLFSTYTERDSDDDLNEFDNWDAGLNLSATYTF